MASNEPEREAPTPTDDIRRLRDLGLSEYASRAYMAALKLGRADAKSISTLARVPPSKVYEVLAALEGEGLLQVFPEFPKKYAAVSLEGYLDRLHAEHTDMAQKISAQREDLLRMFAPSVSEGDAAQGGVMVLRGYARILDALRSMLQDATRTWLVLGVLGTPSRYVEFLDDVRSARERDVHMRLLLPASEADAAATQRLRGFAEVRVKSALGLAEAEEVAIVIADDDHALIIHWQGPDASPSSADVAIATDERAIVRALGSLVEVMWAGAKTP